MPLGAVLQVRDRRLDVLLWQRARDPFAGALALPGGTLEQHELEQSIRQHLAAKVDIQELHLEQLETLGDPAQPGPLELATAYLGLAPSNADPAVPADTKWHPVDKLLPLAFDHQPIVLAARERLRAKLAVHGTSLRTRTGDVFTVSELRDLYLAALGHDVSATNLRRILLRRGLLQTTGLQRDPGPEGGRPAALFRFSTRALAITDQFAVLRPPRR